MIYYEKELQVIYFTLYSHNHKSPLPKFYKTLFSSKS